jgi:hypothetical protein
MTSKGMTAHIQQVQHIQQRSRSLRQLSTGFVFVDSACLSPCPDTAPTAAITMLLCRVGAAYSARSAASLTSSLPRLLHSSTAVAGSTDSSLSSGEMPPGHPLHQPTHSSQSCRTTMHMLSIAAGDITHPSAPAPGVVLRPRALSTSSAALPRSAVRMCPLAPPPSVWARKQSRPLADPMASAFVHACTAVLQY